MRLSNAGVRPAPQMSEKARRDRHRGLALVRFSFALCAPVINPVLKIHKGATDGRNWRRGSNRAGTGAAVQPDQDETSDVLKRPLLGLDLLALSAAADGLDFAVTPARPDEFCSLRAIQPAVPSLALRRQLHLDDAAMEAFAGVQIDGSSEVFKIAARSALVAALLHVVSAEVAVDIGKHLRAAEVLQPLDALLEFANGGYRVVILGGHLETSCNLASSASR